MKHKTLVLLHIIIIVLYSNLTLSEGFITSTTVVTPQGSTPIEQLKINDLVFSCYNNGQNFYPITNVNSYSTDNYTQIRINNTTICCSSNQTFYSRTRNKWIQAQSIRPSELLLCANSSTIMVDDIQLINRSEELYVLTIQTSHTYCVTHHNIITHNFDPIVTGAPVIACLSLACPPIAPVVIATEAIIGSIVIGIGLYSAYKKHKANKIFAQTNKESQYSNSYPPAPKKPDDEENEASDKQRNSSNVKKTHTKKTAQQKLEEAKPLLDDFDEQIENLAKNTSKKPVNKILDATSVHKVTELEQKTDLLYEAIRSTDKDIDAICANTGISRNIITKIKQHVFIEEHILEEKIAKFAPDADMAAGWNRLIKNEYIYSDLKMLQHEYAESLIMEGMDISYKNAHPLINELYNWNITLR